MLRIIDFHLDYLQTTKKCVNLHCVFHSIRFKVNKRLEQSVAPFFLHFSIKKNGQHSPPILFIINYSSVYRSIVCARSGPTEIILIGVSSCSSKKLTYALNSSGNSFSLVIFVISVFQPGNSA